MHLAPSPIQIVTQCDNPLITAITKSISPKSVWFSHTQTLNAEFFPMDWDSRTGGVTHPLTVIWICILACLLAGIPLEWLVSTVLPTFIKQYRWQYLCLLSGLWNEYESGSEAPAFTHFTVSLLSPALSSCSLRAFPVFHEIPVLAQTPQSGPWTRCLVTEWSYSK